MPIRYTHTNIICQDWRRVAAFYQDIFGCISVPPQRDQKGEWLDQGTGLMNAHLQGVHLRLPGHGDNGPTLEIYSYAEMQDKPASVANRKGFGHIAFLVDDVAAILEAVLKAGGSKIGELSQTLVPGVGQLTFIYMADPEGNILEIQNWS